MNGCGDTFEPIPVDYLPNGGVVDETNKTNVSNMIGYNKGDAGYPSNGEVPEEVLELLKKYQGMSEEERKQKGVSFALRYLEDSQSSQDFGKSAS